MAFISTLLVMGIAAEVSDFICMVVILLALICPVLFVMSTATLSRNSMQHPCPVCDRLKNREKNVLHDMVPSHILPRNYSYVNVVYYLCSLIPRLSPT